MEMRLNVTLHKKLFHELTTDELYELLRVRSEVFVVEQNCVYQDLDGDDQQSIHLWLTVEGKTISLARVCPAGTHMKEISIGRVITTERGKGYGKQIMLHAIDAAVEHFDATHIDIEAQEYAKGFYENVGFKQSSDAFMLDGIPHIKMTWIKSAQTNQQPLYYMDYREEAIECVKDNVLPMHKQIYAKYNGDFDRIYTEAYNNTSYMGKVIEPGKEYELSYLECSCPKVKSGLRSNPEQCECSRQSILFILSQLEPDSQFDVRIENTILRGSDRCTFRITRRKSNL